MSPKYYSLICPFISCLMRIAIYPQLPFNKRSPSLRVTHHRRLAPFHARCFVSPSSLLRPKLNLLNSQKTRTAFPLCDLQGGRFLPRHHLLCGDKMFSPSNEFAPRRCLENTGSSSSGKRDSEGNGSALPVEPSTQSPRLLHPINLAPMFRNSSAALISLTSPQNVPVDSLLIRTSI